MKDEQLAKHLLSGASCGGCKFNSAGMCSLFKPVKIKYPDDFQVFIAGMLMFDGLYSGASQILLIGDEIHINQTVIGSVNNSTFFSLAGGETVQIYSRGIDETGKYECQKISILFTSRPFPEENFCKDFISSS